MSLARYRVALRTPGVRRVVLTSLVARAPNGMGSLATLLLLSPHYGYGRAGIAIGAGVACAGLSNPLLSRLVTVVGARPVLVAGATAYTAVMTALAAFGPRSYVAALLCCAGTGLAGPPVVSVVRGLWPRVFAPDDVQALYGLEATAQELIFIVGPALAAAIAAAAGAATAVLVTAALACAGTLTLAASPLFDERPAYDDATPYRVFRGTRLALYVALGFVLTVAFNMCDISIVAFVSGTHATPAAGVVLAVWSAGSLAGGLVFGGRGAGSEPALGRACLAIGIGVAAGAAAPGRAGLAVILFAGGALIAPGLARLYATVATSVPERGATEAFAWVGVGLLAGSSVGVAVGGVTVDAVGARTTFLLASALPVLLGLLLAVRGRSPAPAAIGERLPS